MKVRFPSLFWLSLVFLVGFSGRKVEPEHAFSPGESLEFKLHYGGWTVGRGSFEIEEQSQAYQGQHCYRVIAKGSSAGLLRWLAPVNDEWGALVRVDDLKPLYTFRNIHEGRYQLKEEVFIDPEEGTLKVESIKPHRKTKQRPTRHYTFDAEARVYDLMSGLMTIRDIDFKQISPGDTLNLKTFFENTFYDFRIIYSGKEELKTKFGRLNALKLIPLMPNNAVFDGKHSLEAWFSDDQNRLPLKISARMFVGKASAELISYQNIKYGLDSE